MEGLVALCAELLTHPDIVSLVDPRSNDRVSRRLGDNQLIIRSRNMLLRLAALAVETVINYQYQIVFRTSTG